jgi:hypothetical protein
MMVAQDIIVRHGIPAGSMVGGGGASQRARRMVPGSDRHRCPCGDPSGRGAWRRLYASRVVLSVLRICVRQFSDDMQILPDEGGVMPQIKARIDPMTHPILIVEDDPLLSRLVGRYLEHQQYDLRWRRPWRAASRPMSSCVPMWCWWTTGCRMVPASRADPTHSAARP